jgi:hypothetical protein
MDIFAANALNNFHTRSMASLLHGPFCNPLLPAAVHPAIPTFQ